MPLQSHPSFRHSGIERRYHRNQNTIPRLEEDQAQLGTPTNACFELSCEIAITMTQYTFEIGEKKMLSFYSKGHLFGLIPVCPAYLEMRLRRSNINILVVPAELRETENGLF